MNFRKLNLKQMLPLILLIGGAIGVFCAAVLTLDKINLLEHPTTQLDCNLNPIVACGPVINTDQAHAFGVPNPFLGLVGFGVVATVGAAVLAGAKFKRWFWIGLQLGATFGVGFVTWLQFQSIFRIGALCPYCMATWAVTIPIFWYTTVYNLRAGNLKPKGIFKDIASFLERNNIAVLLIWYGVILAVILQHFWFYWSTLF